MLNGKLWQWGQRWRRHLPFLLLLTPAYLLFLVFTIIPSLQGLSLSLYDADLASRTFVGLDNFRTLAGDLAFRRAVANTLTFAALTAPAILALSLWIAVVVYPLGRAWQTFFRFAFYLPVVASGVVLAMVWVWLYSPVYSPLSAVIGGPVLWLSSTRVALPALAVVVVSWGLGEPVILFLAALENQPQDLCDAALVDGATPLQNLWHITLPSLWPVILFILLTRTVGGLQVVVVVLLLTRGGPAYATETIVSRLYQAAFEFHHFGYAAAMAVVLVALTGIVVAAQSRWLGRRASA